MIQINETMKYQFSQDEMVKIAQEQARHHNDKGRLENELDQIKQDYKAKLTLVESQISGCTLRITSGYEMRQVKCVVLKFRPDEKSKLIVRTDNGRARMVKMQEEEKQLTLSTEENPFIFEADFYEDGEAIATCIAENVPLTQKESEALREVCELRPLRKQIEQ